MGEWFLRVRVAGRYLGAQTLPLYTCTRIGRGVAPCGHRARRHPSARHVWRNNSAKRGTRRDMKWTADRIPDQSGRVAVVTGANSGLGLVTARELARKGAHVVLACRNLAKGEEARRGIEALVPGAELTLEQLDLASLESVRAFAERFRAEHDGLDLLINNAGIM